MGYDIPTGNQTWQLEILYINLINGDDTGKIIYNYN
jgi:hypothetical protein